MRLKQNYWPRNCRGKSPTSVFSYTVVTVMWEYPVTRAYADARIQRIYGGTSEVMKLIIGRDLLSD